jgi:hypothetical protein
MRGWKNFMQSHKINKSFIEWLKEFELHYKVEEINNYEKAL